MSKGRDPNVKLPSSLRSLWADKDRPTLVSASQTMAYTRCVIFVGRVTTLQALALQSVGNAAHAADAEQGTQQHSCATVWPPFTFSQLTACPCPGHHVCLRASRSARIILDITLTLEQRY
jgi:hypothetical protein